MNDKAIIRQGQTEIRLAINTITILSDAIRDYQSGADNPIEQMHLVALELRHKGKELIWHSDHLLHLLNKYLENHPGLDIDTLDKLESLREPSEGFGPLAHKGHMGGAACHKTPGKQTEHDEGTK